MDWFLYDRDLGHEKVKCLLYRIELFCTCICISLTSTHSKYIPIKTDLRFILSRNNIPIRLVIIPQRMLNIILMFCYNIDVKEVIYMLTSNNEVPLNLHTECTSSVVTRERIAITTRLKRGRDSQILISIGFLYLFVPQFEI